MRRAKPSLERYVEVVLDAKARGLPVKLGLEVDFQPGREQDVLDLLAPYPWDFLIGSVHWIGAWDYSGATAPAEFERRGVERAWREYFALETALAGTGMVDVLAHADVIKKVGLRPAPEVMLRLYRPVVAAAAASGMAVEVSSAGLRRASAEIFPAPAFLAMFHGAGVPITLASDGHVAEDAAVRARRRRARRARRRLRLLSALRRATPPGHAASMTDVSVADIRAMDFA